MYDASPVNSLISSQYPQNLNQAFDLNPLIQSKFPDSKSTFRIQTVFTESKPSFRIQVK